MWITLITHRFVRFAIAAVAVIVGATTDVTLNTAPRTRSSQASISRFRMGGPLIAAAGERRHLLRHDVCGRRIRHGNPVSNGSGGRGHSAA